MNDTIVDARPATSFPLKKLCARRMAKAHRSIERRTELVAQAQQAVAQAASQLSSALGVPLSIEARLLPAAAEPARTLSWAGGFALLDLTASGERAAIELELPFLVWLLERLAGRTGASTPVLELTRAEEAAFGFLALVALDAASKSSIFQLFSPRLQSVQTERGAVLVELSRDAHLVFELRITAAERSGVGRLFIPTSAIDAALNAVPESPWAGTLPAIQLDATCRIGRSPLEQDAFEGLSAGDVVVFEGIRQSDGKLMGPAALQTKSFTLHGEFAQEGFTLARSLTRHTLEIPMSATPANLPVEVEIELGRIQLPIAELATLRDGSVLALHLDARQPVLLRVGDRAIARAELVELDGEIGARILNLL
jgi:type III secretion protein Q